MTLKLPFFPKKTQKIIHGLGLHRQTLKIDSGGLRLRPQFPVCDALDLHYSLLITTCSNSDIFGKLLVQVLLFKQNPGYVSNPRASF